MSLTEGGIFFKFTTKLGYTIGLKANLKERKVLKEMDITWPYP